MGLAAAGSQVSLRGGDDDDNDAAIASILT